MKKRCLTVVLCLVVLLVSINPAAAAYDSTSGAYGFSVDGILPSIWTSKLVQNVYYNGAKIGTCCMFVGHAWVNDGSYSRQLFMYRAAMEGHKGTNSYGNVWYGYSKEFRVRDIVYNKGKDELLAYGPSAQSPSQSYSLSVGIRNGGVNASASISTKKDALTIKCNCSTANNTFDVKYIYNKPPVLGWKPVREYMFKESIQVGAFYIKKGNGWGAHEGSYQSLQVTASFYVSQKNYDYNGTLLNGNTKDFVVNVYY